MQARVFHPMLEYSHIVQELISRDPAKQRQGVKQVTSLRQIHPQVVYEVLMI